MNLASITVFYLILCTLCQAENKAKSEVRKFLTAFFETIKNHKDISSLFTDNAHINYAGNTTDGKEEIKKKDKQTIKDNTKIQDYGINQILVSGTSAIAMVVGTEHIHGEDEPFTRVFELTKEDKIGWKIKAMLVFLNTPVTKKNDNDVDVKNLTKEKPKKTNQASKNDNNNDTKKNVQSRQVKR